MVVATFSRKYRSRLTTTEAKDADWRSSSSHSMAARSRPAAGKRFRFNFKILEACAPERLRKAALPLVSRNSGAFKSGFDHSAHGQGRGELRFLLNVAETGSLAQRYLSAIGLDGAGENLQQSRFAGAVGPNQPDAVPFGNGEGDTPKERCGPEIGRA